MSRVSHNQGQSSRYKTRITECVCVCVGCVCVCVCGGGGYEFISLFHRAYNDTRIHINTLYYASK